MTSPPLIIDILIGTIALGVPACLWIARPRDKPSDFERRQLANDLMRLDARWRSLKAARREYLPAWKAYRDARSEALRQEGRTLASGCRNRGT